MASISEFISNVGKLGFTKANRYELFVHPPIAVNNIREMGSQDLRFRVPSITLPQKSLATTETKVYGPVRQAPYSTTYDQLTFSIYLSEGLKEREWFENWMHYVIDYQDHKIRYSTEYNGKLKLLVFNEKDVLMSVHEFQDAFPLSIGEVSFAYGNDDVAQCQITMSYLKYSSETVLENRTTETGQFSSGYPANSPVSSLPFATLDQLAERAGRDYVGEFRTTVGNNIQGQVTNLQSQVSQRFQATQNQINNRISNLRSSFRIPF